MRLTFKQVLLKFPSYSFYQKHNLLKSYRHNLYTRFQANNLFLNTFIKGEGSYLYLYKLSAGLLPDYKKNKKKKRTYMLGFELSFLLGDFLQKYAIDDLALFCKGHGAQKRGIYQALLRQEFSFSKLIDTTSLAHNGTRAKGKRRL